MRYRQLTRRLRVQRGPGNPDLVSERPGVESETGYRFSDLDEKGRSTTLVEFDPLCQVDVAFLARIGAIEELPEEPRRRARKEEASGEG